MHDPAGWATGLAQRKSLAGEWMTMNSREARSQQATRHKIRRPPRSQDHHPVSSLNPELHNLRHWTYDNGILPIHCLWQLSATTDRHFDQQVLIVDRRGVADSLPDFTRTSSSTRTSTLHGWSGDWARPESECSDTTLFF